MNYSALISMMTKASAFDPDAQLFFNAESAAGVTLSTAQKNAINQWVLDSKAIGIWTKMKAVYPLVGGTATAHKFNLKNPLDNNGAYRLVFNGGWTHSSNGALPNGTNAYANTFFAPSVNSTSINNFHSSYYSRTNVNLTQVDAGCGSSDTQGTLLEIRTANLTYVRINAASTTSFSDTDSLGFYSQSRLLGNQQKGYKNALLKVTGTVNSNTAPSQNFYIGAYNSNGTPFYYSSKQCAFATIGDGLTDLESQLFYQITEKYQVALGRNINATQSFYYDSAYNNETNAFLFSTQITNTTIQTATNTLVSDLKTANIWTKMMAIYPMVGGTATTHKFNLVNSQDTNAAFRLAFVGGGTHSSNGYQPNGTNAYAETYIAANQSPITNATGHISYYSRTSSPTDQRYCMGYLILSPDQLAAIIPSFSGAQRTWMTMPNGSIAAITTATTSGLLGATRTATNSSKGFKNNTISSNQNNFVGSITGTRTFLIGAANHPSFIQYGPYQCAFASIGTGLTDAEISLFYTAVQTFQTTLGRQV